MGCGYCGADGLSVSTCKCAAASWYRANNLSGGAKDNPYEPSGSCGYCGKSGEKVTTCKCEAAEWYRSEGLSGGARSNPYPGKASKEETGESTPQTPALKSFLERVQDAEDRDTKSKEGAEKPESPATGPPVSRQRSAVSRLSRGLGTFEDQKLLRVEDFESDVTQDMLRRGLKLPEHVPLVTPSFATKDLINTKKLNPDGSFAGGDISHQTTRSGKIEGSGAGRDPWSVCDYLRDSLCWPRDSIFIDAEQFGIYAHPEDWAGGQSDSYTETGKLRPWTAQGTFTVERTIEDSGKTMEGLLQRNYRGVYKWAQRVSPVLLYFFSAGWTDSDNCRVELDDILHELSEAGGGGVGIRERRVVIFVVLDRVVLKMAKAQQRRFKELCLEKQQIHLVDLSPYMDWIESHATGKGGKKLELAETSEGIQELRSILEKQFGCGSERAYREERELWLREQTQPRRQLPDLKGVPVRVHYLPQFQRRLDINTATVEQMVERLPGVGKTRAGLIYEFIKKKGRIQSLDDLLTIHGIGDGTVNKLEPFVYVDSLPEVK